MIRYNPDRTNAYQATYVPGRWISADQVYAVHRTPAGWQVFKVTEVRMPPTERRPEGERMPDRYDEVFCYSSFAIAVRELPAATAREVFTVCMLDSRCGRNAGPIAEDTRTAMGHVGPCDWCD